MRVLALIQGHYGKRIVEHVRKLAPQEWTIEVISIPGALPPFIDEPEEFLPSEVPSADLLLALAESTGAADLIPAIVELSGAKAVIMPVDDSAWLPLGLKNQLQQELAGKGITAVFPKTFCTLTETSAGFLTRAEPYDDEHIAAFSRCFGKPKLKIKVNQHSGQIEEVVVERGAPCGSTHHVAKELVGMSVEEVIPRAGLIAHHYPCLASMEREQLDNHLFDTLMHISGYVVNEEVEREINPFRKSP